MENGVETDQRVTTKVIVTILDVDDNVPLFQQSLYNVSVLEMDSSTLVNAATTVPGLNMRVSDPDDVSVCIRTLIVIISINLNLFFSSPYVNIDFIFASLGFMIQGDCKTLASEDFWLSRKNISEKV